MSTPKGPNNKSPLLHLSQLINNIRRSGGRAYRSTALTTGNRHISSHRSERSGYLSTPRSRNQEMNRSIDECEQTIVKELFKSWDPSKEHRSSVTINVDDDDVTLVKQRFQSSPEGDTDKPTAVPADGDSGEPVFPDVEPELTINSSSGERDPMLDQLLKENKELQVSLKDFLSQTKLLKNENDTLLKLVEGKDLDNITLRAKLSDVSSTKEKIESALSRTKVDLSEANAQLLICEEDITKLKKQNESVSKEKLELVEQLMKYTGTSDNIEAKIEKATECLQKHVENEVTELKKLLVRELEDVKSQIQKSKSVTSINHDQRSTTKVTSVSEPRQIPTVVTNRQDCFTNSQALNKKRTAFIAGDSVTKILSTAKMCDDNLQVRIRSHPGGRVRTIENTILAGLDKDPEYFNELDAVILHVGTNNISDAASSESITDEFRDTIHTIQSANKHLKIIVSSIIPRKNDKQVNDMIQKTNNSLQMMCQEKGYYFLNNYQMFVQRGSIDTSLYRDNIHLNPKGGKALGTSMRVALNKVLGIVQSTPMVENRSSFHNGRLPGRGTFYNNRDMVFMPVPRYLMDNQSPWFVPNHSWN